MIDFARTLQSSADGLFVFEAFIRTADIYPCVCETLSRMILEGLYRWLSAAFEHFGMVLGSCADSVFETVCFQKSQGSLGGIVKYARALWIFTAGCGWLFWFHARFTRPQGWFIVSSYISQILSGALHIVARSPLG